MGELNKWLNLRAIPVGHLFGTNISRIALKQGAYLRSYVFTFIEIMAPSLVRKMVEQALAGEKDNYELWSIECEWNKFRTITLR